MNVEITALADANLEEIYLRIRKNSPARAAQWRKGLLKAAEALDRFPDRCPLAPESGRELEIRQLVYSRAVYRGQGHGVRAAHSTRRETATDIGRNAD